MTEPGAGSNLFKVASGSNPASVAGAIAGVIREKGRCEMQAIGAGAINQAVKAIAIARGYVAPSGIDLVFVPAFLDIEVGGEERTALKFVIEPRR
jgi:stage V sporulation protein S